MASFYVTYVAYVANIENSGLCQEITVQPLSVHNFNKFAKKKNLPMM